MSDTQAAELQRWRAAGMVGEVCLANNRVWERLKAEVECVASSRTLASPKLQPAARRCWRYRRAQSSPASSRSFSGSCSPQTGSLQGFYDGETRNRTEDTTIFSRMLYQLSYLAGGTILAPRRGLSHWARAAQANRAI